MPQKWLPMRKIREILRLKKEGYSNRTIARICQVSNSTVGDYLARAKRSELSWPLPEGLSEEALYARLFPEKKSISFTVRPEPNWEAVQRELAKRGVSLPKDTGTV